MACAMGVILSGGLCAQGDVLCITGSHAAVEMAVDGRCAPPPSAPAPEVLAPADSHSGSGGCGSCMDIPLGKNLTLPPSSPKHAAAPAASIAADALLWVARLAGDTGPSTRGLDVCAPLRTPILRI